MKHCAWTLEGVARVLRDAARIDNPDGRQHWTAILIENHIVTDGVANHLNANPQRFHRGRIRFVNTPSTAAESINPS